MAIGDDEQDLAPMPAGNVIHIGIETGGTSCKVAVVGGKKGAELLKTLLEKTDEFPPNFVSNFDGVLSKRFPTGDVPTETCIAIVVYLMESIESLVAAGDSSKETLLTLGVLSFGPLCLNKTDVKFGYILDTPKPGWQNFPLLPTLVGELQRKLKASKDIKPHPSLLHDDFLRSEQVVFDTDCNMLAKFEAEYGGHEVDDYVGYITVGTGVGIGVFVNGDCIHGMLHPEGGHMAVPPYEKEYLPAHCKEIDSFDPTFTGTCPMHGKYCIEGNSNNISIVNRLKLNSVAELKGIPDDHYVWDIVGYYLGQLCRNMTLMCSMRKIVLGGGIPIGRGHVLISLVRQHFVKALNGYLGLDDAKAENLIVKSRFGDDLGLLSAIYSPRRA